MSAALNAAGHYRFIECGSRSLWDGEGNGAGLFVEGSSPTADLLVEGIDGCSVSRTWCCRRATRPAIPGGDAWPDSLMRVILTESLAVDDGPLAWTGLVNGFAYDAGRQCCAGGEAAASTALGAGRRGR